ncbi:peptide deformylase [Paenibacillus sp. IHBB 10380]|uniref:peptide deformylase n=1 Tax=Paenibacillus sp. IHBB 10380 TaxID=1566358 RepID=UPI0009E26CFE|nr:peptide deformylase [Paenibacillus sp. IHBB 10380]
MSSQLARCIQHEIDHLNGILYIDHIEDGLFYNEETNESASLLEVSKLTCSNSL